MGNTKISILITLLSCMDLKGNPYTKASVLKIIELLAKMHKITVNRRWVFQCIADMIEAGLLTRRARFKHEKDGTVRQLSSIVAFTLKGALFLVNKGVEKAVFLRKKILDWTKNKDKRFPTNKDIFKSANRLMDKQEALIFGKPVLKLRSNYD